MVDFKYNTPVVLKSIPDDSHNFKPLPAPTGEYPYRLDIRQVLGKKADTIGSYMAFHMVGDTGSARHSDFQALVAASMAQQLSTNTLVKHSPEFLYHLGDIVYNHGEAHEYPLQFLKPYEQYNAPVFAIAGNHDGDINPDNSASYQSLDAFMTAFCRSDRSLIGFDDTSKRTSMVQPNVYWTLNTPLARIIGLYGNVTKHGTISKEQRDWFVEELSHAEQTRENQALIVCLHHAPYSADSNHGSSLAMIDFLESSFITAGVRPDVVFSGHVHNYQRFSKDYGHGNIIPYIVAGAGGYADLHPVATTRNSRVKPLPLFRHNVRLKAYCDNRFGFLKIAVEKCDEGLKITGEYYTLPQHFSASADMSAQLYDRFVIPLKRQAYGTQSTMV